MAKIMGQRSNLSASKRILITTSIFLLSAFLLSPAEAAAKLGTKCSKTGAISGNLVCAKKSGKLSWIKIVKKSDYIDAVVTSDSYLEDGNIPITYSAQSQLAVSTTNLTPNVCQLSNSVIIPLNFGRCQINMTTAGNNLISASSRQVSVVIKRRNVINFQSQDRYMLSSASVNLPLLSSAELTIDYLSETISICTVRGNIVELRSPGLCSITALQRGDEFTDPVPKTTYNLKIMRENKLTFSLPSELAIKLKTYSLTASATSGLPVSFRTLTSETCSIQAGVLSLLKTGVCTVVASQLGDTVTVPAEEVTVSVNISGQRSTEDQPDSVSGYQIKAIYVVPSDGVDRQYDLNGFLAEALTEGNSHLKSGIGYEYQIDSIGSEYDIQFFKSSFTKSYFESSPRVGDDLMKEMKILEKMGDNRKNYIFFVDVESFKNDTACGYANMPGIYAVVAVGPSDSTGSSCVGKSLQLKTYVSHTWVHESFHNLGVDHTTNDSCDLMRGYSTNYCKTSWTIDKDRNRYVGSSSQGVNVLSLRVWKGYTSDQSLRASCEIMYSSVTRSDGLRYAICPTGTQVIGALTYCWSAIRSAELQVWRNNTWVSLGQGNVFNEPWGEYVDWKCNNSSYVAPWLQINVSTPGVQKYRWMVNGTEAEQFNVIWQR